ncbi:hypothetical protein [Solicola gregarius]|uniref:Uncharacterized protein n=1 Tax=Solicola gregarius TaxID=2908642 RepID=A0AA46TKC6_9ACTN|nr:hypothetical protein [Solicola gregarius]UYM06695.1 hypothetical protein L0C25_06390 [Solicola gregarius]
MIEDDLRATFRERAHETDVPVPDRMTRIREKAADQRRHRGLATLAAVVLVVVGLVTVPLLSDDDTGPAPAGRSEETERFPVTIDGYTMYTSVTGDKGQEIVTLTFTPDDLDFLVALDCAERAAHGRVAVVRVNGRRIEPNCAQASPVVDAKELAPLQVGGVGTAEDVRAYWRRHGATAGEPVTIKLSLLLSGFHVNSTEGDASKEFDGLLGIGAYDMTGEPPSE